MTSLLQMLILGRHRLLGVILALILISLGTTAGLLEPWLNRTVFDDIAGVIVAPDSFVTAELTLDKAEAEMPHSLQLVFALPQNKLKPCTNTTGEWQSWPGEPLLS